VASLESARRVDSIVVELYLTPVINGRKVNGFPSDLQSLEIRLNDQCDPLFMWTCSLSEEEFFVLKREQNLLIDFARFPYKLIEMLQQCIAHARDEHPLY